MRPRPNELLSEIVHSLALSFPRAQRILDRSSSDGPMRDLTPARRYLLAQGEVTARVGMTRLNARGLGLEVRLLNLGFESRFRHAEMSQGVVELEVRQVPSPTNASKEIQDHV